MSAQTGALEVEIDLDENVATVDLFDDDECRLWEDEHGWRGFRREAEAYYWIDTRYDRDRDLTAKVRVSEGAVQRTIQAYLAGKPVALPHGQVVA